MIHAYMLLRMAYIHYAFFLMMREQRVTTMRLSLNYDASIHNLDKTYRVIVFFSAPAERMRRKAYCIILSLSLSKQLTRRLRRLRISIIIINL